MTYSGTYAVVLVLHLLTAMFIVGPLAVTAVQSPRLVRAGDAAGLRSAVRTTSAYAVASLLVVLLGTAMIGLADVGEQWGMGQLWVSASYALWIVAVALTLGLVVPAQRSALKALEGGGDAGGYAGRIAAGGGLAMLAWTVIVVLMVTKPGV